MKPNPEVAFLDNGTQLHIDSVKMATNAGRYTCTAVNKVGRAEMDIFLEVIEPPNIMVPATELNVVEGSEQRLECIVTGHPLPKIEWRKGGGELIAQDGVLAAHAPPHTHFLHIRGASQNHAGRYTCIASNKGGEQRQSIQLNVLVPPSIGEGERLFKVAEGSGLALECPANGVPTPAVVWRKVPNGEVLETDKDELGRERLLLNELKPGDGGR